MRNEPIFVSLRPRHRRAGDAGLLPEIGWPASRVFQTFLDNLRLIFSGHGYPTQRAANTSCPRSDRFWLLELRVSRYFTGHLFRPWIPSSAQRRRWTPAVHRGRAQRRTSAGSLRPTRPWVRGRRITGNSASSTKPVAGSTWLTNRRESLGWRLESPGKPGGSGYTGRDAS